MKVNLKLSRVGMNMESATISQWHKSPGQRFTKGEALYDIESEKVTMEIEAPCDGLLLSIAVTAGNDVNVGDTVCTIDNNPAAS